MGSESRLEDIICEYICILVPRFVCPTGEDLDGLMLLPFPLLVPRNAVPSTPKPFRVEFGPGFEQCGLEGIGCLHCPAGKRYGGHLPIPTHGVNHFVNQNAVPFFTSVNNDGRGIWIRPSAVDRPPRRPFRRPYMPRIVSPPQIHRESLRRSQPS